MDSLFGVREKEGCWPLWMNPPGSNVGQWVGKKPLLWQSCRGILVLCVKWKDGTNVWGTGDHPHSEDHTGLELCAVELSDREYLQCTRHRGSYRQRVTRAFAWALCQHAGFLGNPKERRGSFWLCFYQKHIQATVDLVQKYTSEMTLLVAQGL